MAHKRHQKEQPGLEYLSLIQSDRGRDVHALLGAENHWSQGSHSACASSLATEMLSVKVLHAETSGSQEETPQGSSMCTENQ